MLWWSVETFRSFDPDCRIILVVHPYYLEHWNDLFGEEEKSLGIEIHKVKGGGSRIESVHNGLEAIAGIIMSEKDTDVCKVFIHDAARPFVTSELIKRGSEKVLEGTGAVPAIPLTDSIRKLTANGSESASRTEFVAVQTPQIFLFKDIKAAYDALKDEEGLTDDASVAERFGLRIEIFSGEPSNFKITNPSDFGDKVS